MFFLEESAAEIFAGATLLPWAQYWSWFLSGEARAEVTSLGCHSDMWAPPQNDFSSMAHREGWAAKFAPIARAGDAIGTLRADIANAANLSTNTKIHCGLHDSNAALVAAHGFREIADHDATVLSTGTWFIALRRPKQPADLDTLSEERDCLINIDIEGRSIPSARFMGGREIETLIGKDPHRLDINLDEASLLAAVEEVVSSGVMVLPTLASGFGPFPHGRGHWLNLPDDKSIRCAGAYVYVALVTDAMLDLIGAREVLLVEGRFAAAEVFVRALATLRPQMSVFTASLNNDASFGALRLLSSELKPSAPLRRAQPLSIDLGAYRDDWRCKAESAEQSQ